MYIHVHGGRGGTKGWAGMYMIAEEQEQEPGLGVGDGAGDSTGGRSDFFGLHVDRTRLAAGWVDWVWVD